MKTKKVFAIFAMMMLAVPVFTWAGALPDTGQDKCYDVNGEELKNCPSVCTDENGCLREFVDPDNDTRTISKYYYKEGTDTYVEYYYYGFKDCYDASGVPESCPGIECRKKNGDVVTCPSTCYKDNKGDTVTCPSGVGTGETDLYGQDGNYVFDEPEYFRTDDDQNTVTADWTLVKEVKDAKENIILFWLVKEDLDAGHNESQPNNMNNKYTWADATTSLLERLNAFGGYKGYDDWRLPSIGELLAIVDCGMATPAIDTSDKSGYFLNMMSDDVYWSSTPSAAGDTQAYAVNFDDGSVVLANKTDEKYVIAVRGPASGQSEFIDNEDGTVTDTATGLMWLKEYSNTDDWDGALAGCEALVSSGYDDWRLPSRNELNSIIDRTQTPATTNSIFTVDADTSYWTSTSYLKVSDPPPDPADPQAWSVNFADGTIEGTEKDATLAIRPVRGGQNQASGVVISDPKQTTSWMIGRVMPILWSNTGAIKGNVTISISSDAGQTFTPIVENIENDGSYVWWNIGYNDKSVNMNLEAGDNYMLKIAPYVAEGDDPTTEGQNTQGLISIEEDSGDLFGVKVEIADIIRGLQILVEQQTGR